MMFAFSFSMDAQTTIDFEYEDTDEDDYKDFPNKIGRSVSNNLIGYIDWETKSIILPDGILESSNSFELWTDDTCQLQTIDEGEMVTRLSAIKTGFVIIVIRTPNYILTGVYTPQN